MHHLIFEDTQLNPNERIVKSIKRRLIENDGYCPCNQVDTPKEDTKCPCKKYTSDHYCCCTLYVKN